MNKQTKKATTKKPAAVKPAAGTPAIYPAMSSVMLEIGAIDKDMTNKTQKFKFRGAEQAYNALHPILARHHIFTVPRVLEGIQRYERPTRSGGTTTCTVAKIEFDFVSGIDGSKVTVGPILGEAMDSGDKGANKALTVAHKYALFQTFVIPYQDMDDPDNDSPEIAPAAPVASGRFAAPVASGRFLPPEYPTVPVPAIPEPTYITPPVPVPQTIPTPAPIAPVSPPAAAPQTPAPNTSDAPDDMLNIQDESGAIGLTDFLIQLAKNMHSSSVESLFGFWQKNAKVIDTLDQDWPVQFGRLKSAFSTIRASLEAPTTTPEVPQ